MDGPIRCRSGDRCPRAALANERFCAPHLAQLHAIRDELDREARERAPRSNTRRAAAAGARKAARLDEAGQ